MWPFNREIGGQKGQPRNRNAALINQVAALGTRRAGRTVEPPNTPIVANTPQNREARAEIGRAQARVFAEALAAPWPNARRSTDPVTQDSPASQPIDAVVSVDDNRIGSIYFPAGRARMTHSDGPAMRLATPERIQRFNISQLESLTAYWNSVPDCLGRANLAIDQNLPDDERQKAFDKAYKRLHKNWMAETLWNNQVLPAWAKRVEGPEDLPHVDDVDPESDFALFEVYGDAEGRAGTVHLSRGEAAFMQLSAPTVDAIQTAMLDVQGLASPRERNQRFYDHLRAHAPDFADRIRPP